MDAEKFAGVALLVVVDKQHARAACRQRVGNVYCAYRLAHAALKVYHSQNPHRRLSPFCHMEIVPGFGETFNYKSFGGRDSRQNPAISPN